MRLQDCSLLACAASAAAQTTSPPAPDTTNIISTISRTAATSGIVYATPNPDAPSLVEVASSTDELSTLLSVLQQDRFSDLLQRITGGVFTCLAPTNDAFEAFLGTEAGQRFQDDDDYARSLLNYHIMLGVIGAEGFAGEGLVASDWYRTWYCEPEASPDINAYVGGYTDADGNVQVVSGYLETSMVEQANVEFSGGYVHIIDKVLTLPPSVPDLTQSANFTALGAVFALAESAGLSAEAVQQLDQPTLLCPTNMAFANIGSLPGALSPAQVADILMYHVIDMSALIGFASELEDGQELPTLGGGSVTVSIRQGDDGPLVFINGARVVLPDLVLLEGVAHGIDQVLNPNNTVSAPEDATAGVVQYDGAQSVEDLSLPDQPSATTTIALPAATSGSGSSGDSGDDSESGDDMPEQQTGAASAVKVSSGLAVVAAIAIAAF